MMILYTSQLCAPVLKWWIKTIEIHSFSLRKMKMKEDQLNRDDMEVPSQTLQTIFEASKVGIPDGGCRHQNFMMNSQPSECS